MPRFTIRDLLWLTLVMALALGWIVNFQHLAATLDRLSEAAWMHAAEIGSPIMARDKAPPD
jgi:hypothetical protein